MDIYREELNEIYSMQHLDSEVLSEECIYDEKNRARILADMSKGSLVITDASCDRCYIYGGEVGNVMGFLKSEKEFKEESSSDEDIIYSLIHPEDLVDKRLLEYEFFKHVNEIPVDAKINFKATCRLRMKDASGNYRIIDNSTRLLRLSPAGKIWLILCTYDFSSYPIYETGISPAIINLKSGEIISLNFKNRRNKILSDREKEILKLIKDGLPSKMIADRLNISLHTVNRHRQNIIAKLSVGNSIEAVKAAQLMKLL